MVWDNFKLGSARIYVKQKHYYTAVFWRLLKTNMKLITFTNYNRDKQRDKPIRLSSNYL